MVYTRGGRNPFAQCAVRIFGDCDGVAHPRLSLLSGYMSAFNPVIHDMHADAVPLADLIDGECPGRARRTRNPMLETDPIYHVVSEGLASRAPEPVAIEQSSNVIVVILACQVANSVNERCRITKYIRPVC